MEALAVIVKFTKVDLLVQYGGQSLRCSHCRETPVPQGFDA